MEATLSSPDLRFFDDADMLGDAEQYLEDEKYSDIGPASLVATEHKTMVRAIQLLILMGHVSKEKVVEALEIAEELV